MITNYTRKASILLTALLLCILFYAPATFAQRYTVSNIGVSGDMDRDWRSPNLTVTREIHEGVVKLLVDADVVHKEYRHYPLKFEFYVNRHLVATQIRSKELPGPIGIDISTIDTPLPFNYAVIVRLIHPNRTFSTMITGAAFSQDLVSKLACALVLDASGSAASYRAENVTTNQSGNNSFSFSFKDAPVDNGSDSVSVIGVVDLQGEQGSGYIEITRANGEILQVNLSGSADLGEGGALEGFSLESEDEQTMLDCR